jgi:hypothetical protein
MDDRLAALEERLARAESELAATRQQVQALQHHHRQRAARPWLAGLAGTVAVGGALCAAGTRPGGPRAIAAPGSKMRAPFTVVGRGNRPLFRVVEAPGAGGTLRLLDHNGRVVVEAGLLRGEGFRGLRATDANNVPAGAIGQRFVGSATFREVSAHDEQGNVVVNIARGTGLGPLGMTATGLTVLTAGGLPLIDAGIRSDNGQVGFDIADPAGAGREAIRIGFRPPAGADPGLRGLEIDRPSGEPFTAVDATAASGRITLFDAAGTVVFAAPASP